jgi:TonB family protein
MNRLQKKCVLATAGIHLLLFVILLVGPAFFNRRPKADDLQVLDVIPANLIDAQFNSGVRGAQPPPPDLQPAPQPPAPSPVVSQPLPAPSPEPVVKPEPVKTTPAPDKVQPHKIQIDTHLVTRNASQKTSTPDNSAQQARALRKAIKNLKQNFSPSTTVDMPGNSSVAYANYASAVKSVYEQAWLLPNSIASDNENVKVTVTIASDGTVISARIVDSSGDDALDASVQRTLERVTFVAPFPDGSTDKQRTYTINFNPQLKRMLE